MNFQVLSVLVAVSILQIVGANVDTHFGVDPDDLQLREILENVRRVTGAVMGLTEYVMEIRNEIKTLRTEIYESRSSVVVENTTMRPLTYYSGRPIRDPVEFRKQSLELADKVERLLAMDQSPEVDLAKEELRRTVEKNFLRMLAAILVTGPAHTQERSDDIFKLMRSVLNGELDFTPVVQRLPLILRDSETNQFVNLLITLRESERGAGGSAAHILSNIETTARFSGVSSRQIVPNYVLPNSPQINNNVPVNLNQIQNPPNAPSFVNNFPNNNIYQNSLLQQAQQAQQSNINNNRLPINNNNNAIPNNNNNINTNNISNNNGQQQQGVVNQSGSAQTQTPNGSQLPTINSIIEAITQTNQIIRELPSLVEGLQTMVESLEGLFG